MIRLRVFHSSLPGEKTIHSSDNYLNRLYFRVGSNDISYDIQTEAAKEEAENEGESEISEGVQKIQELQMEYVCCLDLLPIQRTRLWRFNCTQTLL